MLKRIIPIWATTILLMMLFSTNIFACACCAEKGHYSISVSKPSGYDLDLLKEMKFSTSMLYTDAGYPDTIKGINPIGDNFSVDGILSGKYWSFNFKDNNGKTGKLNLRKPTSMVSYMVDMHETEDSETSMVTLYKELRFKYKVQNGSGIFSNGINSKTTYFLVLQGRGNMCTEADNFTHWRLEIDGRKAKYAFFGKLDNNSN